jgi:hypothetical protein
MSPARRRPSKTTADEAASAALEAPAQREQAMPEEPVALTAARPVDGSPANGDEDEPPAVRCLSCGAIGIRESSPRGFYEWLLLSLAGSTAFRCERCRTRYAVAVLSFPRSEHGRRHRRQQVFAGIGNPRSIDRRRRLVRRAFSAVAILLTVAAVLYMINRAERALLNPPQVDTPPP